MMWAHDWFHFWNEEFKRKNIENEVVLTMEYSSDKVYRAKDAVLMGQKRINYEFF